MIDIMKCIDGMLNYKESLGFSRHTFEHELNDFGRYFTAAGHTGFTADTVRAWCMRRDTESPSGYRRRLMPLREFSKYLYAMGYADYVIPTADLPIVRRNTPYILSDRELLNLFAEADRTHYCKRNPCRHLTVPVIFRVIYFCGLRPNEGRELRRDDFNFRDRTLMIRKNKAHRERLIPVSDDVANMCKEYLEKSREAVPDSEYMFPSPKGGGPYNRKWLSETFRDLWNASKPVTNTEEVTVYSLRHRFATAVFMKWLDEGINLNACIPYLSAYMGHTDFESTAYYIHLLPKNLLESASVDWEKLNSLIPEVGHED